jgi:hypothetical protein
VSCDLRAAGLLVAGWKLEARYKVHRVLSSTSAT